jgi:hypothetical protein
MKLSNQSNAASQHVGLTEHKFIPAWMQIAFMSHGYYMHDADEISAKFSVSDDIILAMGDRLVPHYFQIVKDKLYLWQSEYGAEDLELNKVLLNSVTIPKRKDEAESIFRFTLLLNALKP